MRIRLSYATVYSYEAVAADGDPAAADDPAQP